MNNFTKTKERQKSEKDAVKYEVYNIYLTGEFSDTCFYYGVTFFVVLLTIVLGHLIFFYKRDFERLYSNKFIEDTVFLESRKWLNGLNIIPSCFHWSSLAIGLLMTLFTWMIVYLDSCQPGIKPPSPLSSRESRVKSGHTFHSSYILVLVIGVLTYTCCLLN